MSDHAPSAIPEASKWPIIGSIALFFIAIGIISWLHDNRTGTYFFFAGSLILSYMLWGWFAEVIKENRTVLYDDEQTRGLFRWGMFWFIISEIMFFAAFFGALFYARVLSVPWLAGEGSGLITHIVLWPNFQDIWPVLNPPDPSKFVGAKGAFDPWRIPALNTLMIIASDISMTWAYWSLLKNRRGQMIAGQIITLICACIFIYLQVLEYGDAFNSKDLFLSSGIYGSTFFMLTGVHATHVIVGIIMVFVMLIRTIKGHFDPQHGFALAATSWYWHFIDFLWIAMFVFVYWL